MNRFEKSVVPSLTAVTAALNEARCWMEARAVPGEASYAVLLAIEELATNAMKYGGVTGPEQNMFFTITLDHAACELEFHDPGREFNPCNAPAPDLESPAEDREPGGLGLHLVKCLMDSMEYSRASGRNTCRMRKLLGN